MKHMLLCIVTLLVVHRVALGGGPLIVTIDGQPVGWETTVPVPYHTDRGRLGMLSNAKAVALVEKLLRPWADVPTATIAFAHAGAAPVNVDATNFGRFLGPFVGITVPLGMNVIVFDEDGTIFEALFGVGTQVLGFASPTFFADATTTVPLSHPVPPGARVIEGLAVLNGKFIDGIDDPNSGNGEVPLSMLEAVFVHEFGHFVGLDHTQIHGMRQLPGTGGPGITQPVETMFPVLIDAGQATLERDDIVALSVLYPTPSFAALTGRITGRVLASNGRPLSGINVIARNIADDRDTVSYVSGATLAPPGTFSLAGLTAGARYKVEVQEVYALHTGGSSVGPFSPPQVMPGPPEFYNGAAESTNPRRDDPNAFVTLRAAAGVTRSNIDIVLNRQSFIVDNVLLSEAHLRAFAPGDFDNNGIMDFVGLQQGVAPGNSIRLYRGRGAGTFDAPVTIDSLSGPEYVVVGHFNAGVDNFLDIAAGGSGHNEVRVYFGMGDGSFGPPTTVLQRSGLPSASVLGLASGDLNGDAFSDLVAVIQESNGGTSVYGLLGSATGGFVAVRTRFAAGNPVPGRLFHPLAVVPFAGSAAGDVVGITADGRFGLLIGNGTGGFQVAPVQPGALFTEMQALATGDFDENGTLDVVLAAPKLPTDPPTFTGSFLSIFLGDGDGGLSPAQRYTVPTALQHSIITADFDGDGHVDIASTGPSGFRIPGSMVHIAFGDGAGGVRTVTTLWGLAESPGLLAAADLDGNHSMDLLVSTSVFSLNYATATYAVLRNRLPHNDGLSVPR